MTTVIPPLPGRRFRPRAALASVRRLLADPDDTVRAIEVFYAIGRGEFERGFQRLLRTPEGRRLLEERPDLLAAVRDRRTLSALPEQSLGHVYLRYLEVNGFDPEALLALNRETVDRLVAEDGLPPLDPARAWWRDRTILAHDFAHVLTGYDTDDLGEAALLGFALGQLPGLATGLLALGASVEIGRQLGVRWWAHEREALQRGRRACWLPALRYEALLALPLATVRTRVGLSPMEEAHPGGLLDDASAGFRRRPRRAAS